MRARRCIHDVTLHPEDPRAAPLNSPGPRPLQPEEKLSALVRGAVVADLAEWGRRYTLLRLLCDLCMYGPLLSGIVPRMLMGPLPLVNHAQLIQQAQRRSSQRERTTPRQVSICLYIKCYSGVPMSVRALFAFNFHICFPDTHHLF